MLIVAVERRDFTVHSDNEKEFKLMITCTIHVVKATERYHIRVPDLRFTLVTRFPMEYFFSNNNHDDNNEDNCYE